MADIIPTFKLDRFCQILQGDSGFWPPTSVRHLFLENGEKDDINTVLTTCSGVTNLFLCGAAVGPSVLSGMHSLQKLNASLSLIFSYRAVDITHSMFRNITHLEIFDSYFDDVSMWTRVSLVPHLTHLAFNFPDILIACPGILQACPKLQYLVFLPTPALSDITTHAKQCELLREDIRFVAMMCRQFEADWKMGAYSGEDYWARAEAFVAAKRAGTIDRKLFSLRVSAGLMTQAHLVGLQYRVPGDASELIK